MVIFEDKSSRGTAWFVLVFYAYLPHIYPMFSVGAFMFLILLTEITGAGADKWVTAVFFMIAMGVLSWILYAIMTVDEGIVKKKKGDQGVIGWMITYFKDTGLISEGLAQITASVL